MADEDKKESKLEHKLTSEETSLLKAKHNLKVASGFGYIPLVLQDANLTFETSGISCMNCGARIKFALATKGEYCILPFGNPMPLVSPENAKFAFSGGVGISLILWD